MKMNGGGARARAQESTTQVMHADACEVTRQEDMFLLINKDALVLTVLY
jgi:hypothetical protein